MEQDDVKSLTSIGVEDLKTQSYLKIVFTYIQTYFDRCKLYAITAAHPSTQHLCKSFECQEIKPDLAGGRPGRYQL